MNPLEQFAERLVGYEIDWSATGTWMQLVAALVALYGAWRISRAELIAQRTVAAEDRHQFAELVRGIGSAAAAEMVTISELLRSRDAIEACTHGDLRIPSMAAHVALLRGLDLNRMPNALAASCIAELRRLAGWAAKYQASAFESYRKHDSIDPDLDEALSKWRSEAQATEIRLLEALRDPVPPRLKGTVPIRRIKAC